MSTLFGVVFRCGFLCGPLWFSAQAGGELAGVGVGHYAFLGLRWGVDIPVTLFLVNAILLHKIGRIFCGTKRSETFGLEPNFGFTSSGAENASGGPPALGVRSEV